MQIFTNFTQFGTYNLKQTIFGIYDPRLTVFGIYYSKLTIFEIYDPKVHMFGRKWKKKEQNIISEAAWKGNEFFIEKKEYAQTA
jgi:hypothetical protein